MRDKSYIATYRIDDLLIEQTKNEIHIMTARRIAALPVGPKTVISLGLIGTGRNSLPKAKGPNRLCCSVEVDQKPVFKTELVVTATETPVALSLLAEAAAEHIFSKANDLNYQLLNGVNPTIPLHLVKNEFCLHADQVGHFSTRLNSLLKM